MATKMGRDRDRLSKSVRWTRQDVAPANRAPIQDRKDARRDVVDVGPRQTRVIDVRYRRPPS